MFTPYQVIAKVKETFLHNGELIICHSNKGITLYKAGKEEKVSDIAPWYACTFNDYFLFQEENGGPVQYFSVGNGSSLTPGTIDGAFYLFRSLVDGDKLYIPTPEHLSVFDRSLQPINSHQVGRTPVAIHNGNFYRVTPHLSCFSLQDRDMVWTMEQEELMEEKGGLTSSYLYLKNDLLIIRSKLAAGHNHLTAFHPADGTIAWQQQGYLPSTILLGDQLYVFYYLHRQPSALEGRLLILDCKTGAILKELLLTDELQRNGFRVSDHYSLARQGDYLYFSATYGKTLYALNIETGRIAWKHSLADSKASWLGDIKVYNNDLFVLDEREGLHVLKREG